MMKYKILLVSIVLIMLLMRLQSAIKNLGAFYLTLEPIFSHPHATYSEKMSIMYPVYFDFITEVKAVTPDDSTIYIPPIQIQYENNIWPIANLQISSSLLFPRNVAPFNNQNCDKNSYIVITGGYPQEKLKAKKIYIIGKEPEEIIGDYDPLDFNKTDNGLIQL